MYIFILGRKKEPCIYLYILLQLLFLYLHFGCRAVSVGNILVRINKYLFRKILDIAMRLFATLQLLVGTAFIPGSSSWPVGDLIHSDSQSKHVDTNPAPGSLQDSAFSDSVALVQLAWNSDSSLVVVSETPQKPDIDTNASQAASQPTNSLFPAIALSQTSENTILSSASDQDNLNTVFVDFTPSTDISEPIISSTLQSPITTATLVDESTNSETNPQIQEPSAPISSAGTPPAEIQTSSSSEFVEVTSTTSETSATSTEPTSSTDNRNSDPISTSSDTHAESTPNTPPTTSTASTSAIATASKHTVVQVVTKYVDGSMGVGKLTKTIDGTDNSETQIVDEDNQPFTSTVTIDGNVIVVTNTQPLSESSSSGSSCNVHMRWNHMYMVRLAAVVGGSAIIVIL